MAKHDGRRTAVGIAGAVIGATVAVAAAKILSDKKTRKTVVNKLHDVKEQVINSLGSMKEEVINLDDKVIQSKTPKKASTKRKTTKKKKLGPFRTKFIQCFLKQYYDKKP